MFREVMKRLTAVLLMLAMAVMLVPAGLAEELDRALDVEDFELPEAMEPYASRLSGVMLTDFDIYCNEVIPRIPKYGFETFYFFDAAGTRYMGLYDANGNAKVTWTRNYSKNARGYTTCYTDLTKLPAGKYTMLLWTTHTEDIPFTYYFTISDNVSISGATVSVDNVSYTGEPVTPKVEVSYKGYPIVEGREYTVSYSNNVEVGTGTVTIKGIGVFSGTITKTFTISPISLTNATIECEDCLYTGDYVTPPVKVTLNDKTLVENVDYTVEYSSNLSVTNYAKVKITGIGNYKGTVSEYFRIYKYDINGAEVTGIPESYEYTGSAYTPEPVVAYSGKSLRKSTNYTVAYKDNVNAGPAQVLITGKGDYGGTLVKTFVIEPIAMDGAVVQPIADQVYTGANIIPEVSLTLNGKVMPVDGYEVTATENVNVGTAKAVIKGKGNYTGSVETSFNIVPANVSGADVADIPAQLYTGSAVTPKPGYVKVNGKKLVEGVDYTLSYANNVNVGTATVGITGKGNYTGMVKKNFAIKQMVQEIKLSADTLVLKKGASEGIGVTVLPANATNKNVTWTSSNTAVATVDVYGTVKAVKPGTAVITATAADGSGVKASVEVTVMKKTPKKVTLNKTKLKLKDGEKFKLVATVTPEKADNKKVIWTSSNPEVATVNQKGKVKAVGVGTAEITATTVNGKKAVCKVTVKPQKVTSIEIKGKKNMVVGATQTLTVKILPKKATNQNVVWSCNKPDVAVIDENGVVTALKKGTVKITATAADGSKVKAEFKIKIKVK